MFTVIRNAEIYAPDHIGKKDILIAFEKIAMIEDEIKLPDQIPHEVIDANGKIIFPGFIDSHVHITGGGGEGSYRTRTPELTLSKATSAGVTTIVGVIGTDGTTRTMPDLIAKARGLEEEGITCYVHTGSYQVPVKTLTGKIEDDIILIDRVIGAGEIAISDHRSSQPTVEEMAKIASAARIGGMLSGKAGIVNIHLGDSPSKLSLLEQVVETTDIPIKTFHPTHINRTEELFEAGVAYGKKGGNIDFTTSTIPQFLEEGEVKCSTGLKRALEAGVPVERITFTSDGQASLPAFNASGEFEGLQIGSVASLYKEVRDAIVEDGVPISDAIKVITKNPASLLKLSQKGEIAVEKDADLVIVDSDFQIDTVFARGCKMVEGQECLVKGTFE
ncbi:beta-aspartyl-peptidase [Pseudalkalibacillus hwajinpoensis]|uniref:beta-aspartyl-peptidase n=1 Tax=Guptibacillus hwajinpoensis TaxID=208199 RepID=UPI001CD6952B|nr:beta-aspartyl-peptidase [Pseudalkalibacillus hwajinpoensis]MCA0992187.1 beta-aspartyl-peptidase [Pseudalkalibacillus hwajinpoensis]